MSKLNPLDRITGSGERLDLSKLDPTRNKVINGELYVWQPDVSGATNRAGSGADYDSNVDLGDAGQNSAGGTWVKADPYKDPSFGHLLKGYATAVAQTGAYAAGANAAQGAFGGAQGAGGAASGSTGNAAAAGATGSSTAPSLAEFTGGIGADSPATMTALGGGAAKASLMSRLGGSMSGADWGKLALGGASALTDSYLQNKQANATNAQNQAQLDQQQRQFDATLANNQHQFDSTLGNQQGMQAAALAQADPLTQQRSRQKNALLSSLLSHYTPTTYNKDDQSFSGGVNDLQGALQDPTVAALFSQQAAQDAESQFTANAKAGSGGQYVGPGGTSKLTNTALPTPTGIDTPLPIMTSDTLQALLQEQASPAKRRLLSGLV